LSKSAITVFSADLKPGRFRLAAIWFFLIVLPALYLNITSEKILDAAEQNIREKVRTNLVQELNDFRDHLNFSAFLQAKLDRFILASNSSNSDAEELAAALARSAGLKAAFIINISTGNNEFSIFLDPETASETRLVSRTILKNFLAYLNSNHSQSEASHKQADQQSDPTMSRGAAYMRSFFATAGSLVFKPDTVITAFSGRPLFGRLLFYYHPYPPVHPGKTPGGIIFAIRERDIAAREMLSMAKQNNLFSGFRRGYTRLSMNWHEILNLSEKFTDFFTDPDGSVCLVGMASPELIVRLLTNGTLFPCNLEKIENNIPGLLVKASAASMVHPFRPIFERLRRVSLVAIMLVSIIFLHMQLFGYGRNLGIRTRLFLSVLGVSVLPFATFIATVSYQRTFA
jgi:hypothetical protein